MPSKQSILDNVDQYEPRELVDYINDGIVTRDELFDQPELTPAARKKIDKLLNEPKVDKDDANWKQACDENTSEAYTGYLKNNPKGKHRDEARAKKNEIEKTVNDGVSEQAWKDVNKSDINALKGFIEQYPNSPHKNEANKLLSQLNTDKYRDPLIKVLLKQIRAEVDPHAIASLVGDYLSKGGDINALYVEIKQDPNLLPATAISILKEKGYIDLASLGDKSDIDDEFLSFIENEDLDGVVIDIEANSIDEIKNGMTEVYFWGIPSSGKTCALGAILCEACNGEFIKYSTPITTCQGYEYMTMLRQLFEEYEDGVIRLPESTQTDQIFEMEYEFTKKEDNKKYPITLVDLAGETIYSMYQKNAKKDLNDQQDDGLRCAERLLTGNNGVNRKIHFFVLEYNGDKKTYYGLTQRTLLDGALGYIKDTGIFKKETDAICLLVTKSDLANASNIDERNAIITKYIQSNYKQFYNGLKGICEENDINRGKVAIIPFSLGKVCFKNLCLFNPAPARNIVSYIINHATPKLSWWQRVFGK